jgi:hypothetical protein
MRSCGSVRKSGYVLIADTKLRTCPRPHTRLDESQPVVTTEGQHVSHVDIRQKARMSQHQSVLDRFASGLFRQKNGSGIRETGLGRLLAYIASSMLRRLVVSFGRLVMSFGRLEGMGNSRDGARIYAAERSQRSVWCRFCELVRTTIFHCRRRGKSATGSCQHSSRNVIACCRYSVTMASAHWDSQKSFKMRLRASFIASSSRLTISLQTRKAH